MIAGWVVPVGLMLLCVAKLAPALQFLVQGVAFVLVFFREF